jgi:uncharacterized protein with HEPN domain
VPPREWRLYIDDILASIARVEEYTRGVEYEQFVRDSLRMDAVLHNFMIIGEAASRISPNVQQRAPSVPWPKMRAMRNIIVHGYFGVELEVVWDTARNDLPTLVPALQAALADEGETTT